MIVSASCGVEGGRVIPYKPLLDKAIEIADGNLSTALSSNAPRQRRPWSPGEIWSGRR